MASAVPDGEAWCRAHLREIREVGCGAHGRVVLVEHVSTGDRYVLKHIPLAKLANAELAVGEVEVLDVCHRKDLDG